MGVRGLWKIIRPVREVVTVESLRGKVLAIDLAIWVVQAQVVTGNTVHGVYLRNLYFKVCHLLEHGIGVIVVADGKAPVLKAQTIANRLGVSLDRNSKVIQRRRFQKLMKECETLVSGLGIPVIRAAGEAEATAAKLVLEGRADGVVTSDGDAFLYGARVVYRNLTVGEETCEKYDMSRVEYELGLSRDDLIGLGILLGCDFNPNGVSGVSRVGALKYINSRDRMRCVTEELTTWNKDKEQIQAKYKQLSEIKTVPHCSVCKHNGSKKEHNSGGCPQCPNGKPCTPHNDYNATQCQCIKHIATRLLSSPHMQCCVKFTGVTIPTKEIVSEFYNTPVPVLDSTWSVPHGYHFVNLMHQKLEWRRCNAAVKFSHIAALQLISQSIVYTAPLKLSVNNVVKFNHILKTRVKDGVDMLELEFQIIDKSLAGCTEFDILYLILERGFVEQVLPEAVAEFEALAVKHKRKKKETTTITERHSPKAPAPVIIEEKPKVKPKKRAPNKKKEITPIPSPPPLDDITDGIESLDLSNSSDEEILPLAERLARRKHSNFSIQSSATSLTSESEKSVAKWLSESLSSGCDDKENTAPPSPRLDLPSPHLDLPRSRENSIVILDTLKQHEREDSNVQIIPDEFMTEYLDLSRNEILEISQKHGSDSPALSREPTFEVSESVTSEDYRLRLSEMDYNQLAFVTPLKSRGGLDEEVDGGRVDDGYLGLNEGRGDAFGDGLGLKEGHGISEDVAEYLDEDLDEEGPGYLGVDDGSFTDVTNLSFGVNDSQALNSYLEGMDDSFGLRVNDNGSVIIGAVETAENVDGEKAEDSFVVQEEFNDDSLIELTKGLNMTGGEVASDIMKPDDNVPPSVCESQQTTILVESPDSVSQSQTGRLDSFIDHVLADTSQIDQSTAEVLSNTMAIDPQLDAELVVDASQTGTGIQNDTYFNDTMDPQLEAELLQAAAENDVSYVTKDMTFNDSMDAVLEAELVQAAEQLLLNVETPHSQPRGTVISELLEPQRDLIVIDAGSELVQHEADLRASFDDSIVEISKPHPSIIPSIPADTPNLTLDSFAFSPASRITSVNTTFAKQDLGANFNDSILEMKSSSVNTRVEHVRQDLGASFDNRLSFSPASRTFATPSKLPDISSFSPTAPLSPMPHVGDLSLDLSTELSPAESLKMATVGVKPLDLSLDTERRALDLMSADLSLDNTDSLSLDTTGHLSLNNTDVEDLTGHLRADLSFTRHAPLPDLSIPAALPDIQPSEAFADISSHVEAEIAQLAAVQSEVLTDLSRREKSLDELVSPLLLANDTFEQTLPQVEPWVPQDMVPASLITNPNLSTAPFVSKPRPLVQQFSFSNPTQPSLLTTRLSDPTPLVSPPGVAPPFNDPVLDVTTPVWKKRPLSDITSTPNSSQRNSDITSTPNSSQRNSDNVPAFDIDALHFGNEALPDIGSNTDLERRFDIDISNLLNST